MIVMMALPRPAGGSLAEPGAALPQLAAGTLAEHGAWLLAPRCLTGDWGVIEVKLM